MPKTKDQKRAEAIERGKISFAVKYAHGTRSRFSDKEEYLDLFRQKQEITHREFNLIYNEDFYLRKSLPDQESHLDCIGVSHV